MAGDKKIKGLVKFGYWDTEQGAQPPALIGQIQGTPTIKLFKPKPKKNKKFKKKDVIDYNGERKAKAMRGFALSHLANHVERIEGAKGYDAFVSKAKKYGLPQVLVFSKQSSTSPLLKYMSVEYRRRALFGEIKGTALNSDIVSRFKVNELPAMLAVPVDKEPVRYTKDGFTFGKVNNFVGRHALKSAVTGKHGEQNDQPERKKESQKDEL